MKTDLESTIRQVDLKTDSGVSYNVWSSYQDITVFENSSIPTATNGVRNVETLPHICGCSLLKPDITTRF